MLILNSPDYWLLTPDSSPKVRFLIFARDLILAPEKGGFALIPKPCPTDIGGLGGSGTAEN